MAALRQHRQKVSCWLYHQCKIKYITSSVYLVRPLSKSRGYRYMLTILDEAIPMIEATSEACCHAFLHAWVARYGLPMSATSDNGNSFIAKLWKDLNSTLNIKEVFVPFYHQATNGIVERVHSSIKKGLKDMLWSV